MLEGACDSAPAFVIDVFLNLSFLESGVAGEHDSRISLCHCVGRL